MNNNIIDRFNSGINFDDLYQKDVALKYCILTVLSRAKGHDNRISRTMLVAFVRNMLMDKGLGVKSIVTKDRKIRNTIRDLRQEGALILSTGGSKGGYWLGTSLEEIKVFINAEYRSRALDMLYTSSRMLGAAGRQFGGQTDFLDEYNRVASLFESM